MSQTYGISDLAKEFGVTTRTIRFYEEKGLLEPSRVGNRRVYSPADRTRLRLILRGKRLGFSLDESAEIVMMYGTPGSNRRQLQKLIDRIREKQDDLRKQQSDLSRMLEDLHSAERRFARALQNMKQPEGND